jgi:putative FmdB family regulatory protein
MPIYEYECTKCGKIDEVLQKFTDAPKKKCRYCSGKVHKLISQSSFHLKGTGWYVTDYANRSRSSSASPQKEEKKSADSGKKSSEKKADAKSKAADKTS